MLMKRPTFTSIDPFGRIGRMIARFQAWIAQSGVQQPSKAAPSDAVVAAQQALCRGAITLDDYLNIKIDATLRPLEEVLQPEDLAVLRSMLRAQIQDTPAWNRLVADLGKGAARRSRTQ
jgi:hypothetical protein